MVYVFKLFSSLFDFFDFFLRKLCCCSLNIPEVLECTSSFVVAARPMTDLSWICQHSNCRIFRSANLCDEEKDELLTGSTSAPEWRGEGEGSLQNHDCRLWLNSYRYKVLARTSRVRDPLRITRLTSLSKRTSKQSLPTRPNLLPYTKEVWTFWHVF